MTTTRRGFLETAALAAGGLAAGCATRKPAFRLDEATFVKGALIHLGSNMWCDRYTPAKVPQVPGATGASVRTPESDRWDFKDRVDYLRADDKVWCEVTEAMAKAGMNLIVIDLGEALVYPSHPELAVKGSWSPARMRRELERLRGLGLEPVPKLNFSTTHNAWMKDWRHVVSSPAYMRTVKELIEDVVDVFDGPRLFHVGYDEETIGHQGGWGRYEYIVVRRGQLWWKDFLYTVDCVRRAGSRPWCFSDQSWYERELFVEKMPRDVVQCPWNFEVRKGHPEYVDSIDDIAKCGFDVIADCAAYPGKRVQKDKATGRFVYTPIDRANRETEFCRMMAYCGKTISREHLKGFILCPWVTTTPGIPREVLLDSIDYAGAEFARFARQRS